MARKRKACEFCEDNVYGDYVEDRNGYCLWFEFYPFNRVLSVISQANDEDGEMIEHDITFDVNFCPVCGRKLEHL